MNDFTVSPIGVIEVDERGMRIRLGPEYKEALLGLTGFSHVNVIWWFSQLDSKEARAVRTVPKPYQNAPEALGVFATRSPVRPNPLALTAAQVLRIIEDEGVIELAYIDAFDQSPVLDVKPYTPSCDRVESPLVPAWCSHWPESVEQSGDFDWESEFTF